MSDGVRDGPSRPGLRLTLPWRRAAGGGPLTAAAQTAPAFGDVVTPAAQADGGGRPPARGRTAGLSFFFLVLLPAAGVAGYYAFIAADQYAATAKLTVRETRGGALTLDGASDGGALGGSEAVSHLTHVVVSYIRSRAMVEALHAELDITAIFRRPEADFWTRMDDDASVEEIVSYWNDQVSAAIDGPSNIVTLRVRAFRPEDARLLAEAALRQAETLVNTLSRRRKEDALLRARDAAALSEARLMETIAALSALRDSEQLLDPRQEGAQILGLIGELMAERIRIEGEIDALAGAVDADSVRLRALRERSARLESDIAALRETLAGAASADANVAAALARFQEADIRLRFASRLYELGQAAVIDAEIDLARQSVYIEIFDPPGLPQESRYPRRLAFSLLALAALAAFWSIGALVIAAVRDHRIA